MNNKIPIIVAILTLVSCVGYAVWENMNSQDKTYSWRYKMIVEVETPEGVRAGSSVREVRIHEKAIGWDKINNQPHYSKKYEIDGEAVVIDLGRRGKLFALIDDRAYADVLNAFKIQKFEEAEALPSGSSADFDVSKYPGGPKLVTFTNINDPKTVMAAMVWSKNPQGEHILTENNMEVLFGKGVKLKKIIIERANSPVGSDIDKDLPWLRSLEKKKARLNGSTDIAIFTNDLSDNLGAGSFRTTSGD